MNKPGKDLYKESGVDISAGNKAVKLIKDKVDSTLKNFNGRVISAIGGFAAIVECANGTILVVSTDGVGTKLRTASVSGLHNKVGIDLVAMVVNDILVYGADNGLFLDYLAQGIQVPERTDAIVEGIVSGCDRAGFALVGGEMAELPGFYKDDEYDLAGFGVGILPSRDLLVLGEKIKPGVHAYGLASSGLHSNGYSLVWKAFGIDFNKPDEAKEKLLSYDGHSGLTLLEEISEPTILYKKRVAALMKKYEIMGMANITGGGLVENPPRILPPGCAIKIKLATWPTPHIFSLIQKAGGVTDQEMRRVFNCGIGFVVYSPDEIKEPGVYKIGRVIEGQNQAIFE